MKWQPNHLSCMGHCERWSLSLLQGVAYISRGDARWRKDTGMAEGWWLQCNHVFGYRDQRLEAETTEEAKFEASERIATALVQLAKRIRTTVYHLGVDDGTVPACMASPPGASQLIFVGPAPWHGQPVLSTPELPDNGRWCPACVHRMRTVRNDGEEWVRENMGVAT